MAGNRKSTHKILPVASEDRVYLNKRPLELRQKVANLTELQSNLFEEKHYRGKWIRIKGPIDSILGTSFYATLVFIIDGIITHVELQKEFIKRVSHLQSGDVITVDAMFKSMDRIGPDFEKGEIVAVE